MALKIYTQFSDAQYYKALCLKRIGKDEEAIALHKIAKFNSEQGYSFNEDSNMYERFPYQVRWFQKTQLIHNKI